MLLYLSRLSSYLNISFGTLLICINFESLDLTIEENFSKDLLSGESAISPLIIDLKKEMPNEVIHTSDKKDINIGQEDRDYFVFASKFSSLGEITKSYIIRKKYLPGDNNIRVNKITLTDINENKTYDLFLQGLSD